jgi:hypothetical protein
MMAAASVTNYVARLGDVSFVIDELERQNADSTSPLHGRIITEQIGMAGHSFGAMTAQAQPARRSWCRRRARFSATRGSGVVAMSPPRRPKPNLAAAAFAKMAAPIF